MAAAGLYTIGGSFWEFGEVDWDHINTLFYLDVQKIMTQTQLKWD